MATPEQAGIFGWQLHVELSGCDRKLVGSKRAIRAFTPKLCEVINMQTFGKPLLMDMVHPTAGEKFIQLVQLIETSAVVGFFRRRVRTADINIFSCAPFDPDAATQFTQQYFGASMAVTDFRTRGTRIV